MEIIEISLEGTLKDEKTLHKLLKSYKFRTEWFYDFPEVYKIWNDYTKYM